MAFPSPTKRYHTEAYPGINPTSPKLSTKGKNVVITRGGSDIGPEITLAFAKSSASNIALLGRKEKTLLSTKKRIEDGYPDTEVATYVADLVDKPSLEKALSSIARVIGPTNQCAGCQFWLPPHI